MSHYFAEMAGAMPEEQQPVESTTGYLLLPMQDWQTSTWHASPLVMLPAGCVSVRVTLSPSQEVRESPLLAGEVRLAFRDAEGRRVQGCGSGIVARPAFAADESVPVTGHQVGQQPGGFPPQAASFAFVVNDSLGAQQQPPYGILAGIEFRISHQEQVYIQAAATLEAFDAAGNSLEIA
jgi:hypothetical protein